MAEVASPTTPELDGASKNRPEKPDEAKYKADLEQAEKNHKAAQAKLVGYVPFLVWRRADDIRRMQFVRS